MANKSVHQLAFASNRLAGDLLYIVRSGSDYRLDESKMAPAIQTAVVTLSSAQVLALNTTPILVVPAADAGTVIVPMRGLVEFSGGSNDYAANTDITVGSTTTIGDSNYVLEASISDRTKPNTLTLTIGTTAGMVAGDSLSVRVKTGNPTTGNSTVKVTVWYYIFSV